MQRKSRIYSLLLRVFVGYFTSCLTDTKGMLTGYILKVLPVVMETTVGWSFPASYVEERSKHKFAVPDLT